MIDHELVLWAHKYATTIHDRPSLNYARDKLLQSVRDNVDVYVLISPDEEYCPLFLEGIREGLEALQLVAKGLANE